MFFFRGIIFFILVSLTACSTNEIIEEKPIDLAVNNQAVSTPTTVKKQSKVIIQKAPEPSGSPMGSAVQTMRKAEHEMADTVKLVAQLRAGDQILDCQGDKAGTFKTIATFFGPRYFGYDRYNFWFKTANNGKVSVSEHNGIIRTCKIGMFTSFRRLITIQFNGRQKIRTEFYFDATSRELMVHRYLDGVRVSNDNYRLAGF